MQLLFALVHKKFHETLEACQPRVNRVRHPSKVLIVAFLPDTPGGQHKKVHKDGLAPLLIPSANQPKTVVKIRPMYPQLIQALHTEGAMKEEVLHSLLRRLIAK